MKRLFSELVRQAIEGLGAPLPVPEDLVEMRTMLAALGESWKRQWLAEGKAEGEAKALLRLIEKRFGPISSALRERIMAADPASVEQWFDRAIDAPDLEAVFDQPN